VADESDGHDQRHVAAPVAIDQRQQLALVAGVEVVLEEAEQVLQHVAMAGAGRRLPQRLHQQRDVVLADRGDPAAIGRGHQPAEFAVTLLVVCQHDELVARVELDQSPRREPLAGELLPAMVDEHALDEIFAQHRVHEPTLFLERQLRQQLHQRAGIDAGAG